MSAFENDVRQLFNNYNNINEVTANDFVTYIFTLIPLGGGTITGDLTVLGKTKARLYDNAGFLSVDPNLRKLFGTDGVTEKIVWDNYVHFVPNVFMSPGSIVMDSTGIKSQDWNSRLLAEATGVTVVNYDTLKMFDSTAGESFDWENRQARNSAGNVVFNWETQQLLDVSTTAAIDYNQRQLLDSTGAAAVIGWGNGLGFFAGTERAQQTIANTAMVVLADVIAVVDSIRDAIGDTGTGYNLVQRV